MTDKKIKVVLKDSEWLRGKNIIVSKKPLRMVSVLRRPTDGRMCCLGVLMRTLGVAEDRLDNVATPAELDYGDALCAEDSIGVDFDREDVTWPPWIEEAIRVNDNRDTTDEAKIDQLNALAPDNISFVFEADVQL